MTTELFRRIITYLAERGFHYEVFEHAPVFTADVASQISDHSREEGTKSLALRGQRTIVVVTVAGNERVDFRQVATLLGEKKLSMANSELLSARLGSEVGGLAPFGYDSAVRLAVSESLFKASSVYFNPGRNDMTVRVSGSVFCEIMQAHNAVVIRSCQE